MKEKDLKIGDLVTHVLYGREWIGVIVNFREEVVGTQNKRKKKALVQLQPGTKYENFFMRSVESDKINDNLGYVSVHWLFKARERNGNSRSTRSKTPTS